MASQPTPPMLASAVNMICKVVGQIPTFHVYEKYVACRFGSTTEEISLESAMHNAVLDSTLISLRCFNEFFRRDGRQDDIRAHQFAGISLRPFLVADDHSAIDKHLAHMTLPRIDIATKGWFLDDMVVRALRQGVQFLSLIETGSLPLSDTTLRELRVTRQLSEVLIPLIMKLKRSKTA